MSATATKRVKCGHCSRGKTEVYHASFDEVRECSKRSFAARAAVQEPLIPTPPPAKIEATVTVPDGVYTVVFEDQSYRTLRVRTQDADDDFKPGVQLIGYLAGPDNTSSYKNFGHIDARGHVRIWQNFRENLDLAAACRVLVADPKAAAAAYGLASKHCGLCGRPLSRPDSLARGIGPKCAEDRGWL